MISRRALLGGVAAVVGGELMPESVLFYGGPAGGSMEIAALPSVGLKITRAMRRSVNVKMDAYLWGAYADQWKEDRT